MEVPLAESYTGELKEIGRRLNEYSWKHCCSSPRKRCTRLADDLQLDYQIEEALAELDFGRWEGKLWEEIPRQELDRWGNDWQNQACPGGESFRQQLQRVESFARDLPSGKNSLWLTHGGVIRCLYYLFASTPAEKLFEIEIPFGSLHSFSPRKHI